MFKSLTLALVHIPVYLMICCLMGTYVCVGTTIQEKGSNDFDRYLYSWGTCK